MPEEYIWIVTDDAAEASVPAGQKGSWTEEVRQKLSELREVKLNVSDLEQKMNAFLQLVGRLFKQVNQQIDVESGMQLDEVELLVEISGEGEVKLVAGGKAAGKGAIKLKFKRLDAK
jgi:DNA-binding ferritin-like protein